MYIYLLRRCDSSIGIGKATRHHEFNDDEIGFCLVLGIACPEQPSGKIADGRRKNSMYQY
jgi:hypothetical protein